MKTFQRYLTKYLIEQSLFAKESYNLLLNFFKERDTQEFREIFNTYKNLKI